VLAAAVGFDTDGPNFVWTSADLEAVDADDRKWRTSSTQKLT